MGDKTDAEIFLEYVPAYYIWYKIILIYTYHIIIFIFSMIFFWWMSYNYLISALIIEFGLSCGANIPFIYMFKNSDKIRKKYEENKGNNSWQHFFFNYSYTSPLGCAALYAPLILKADYLLPSIVNFSNNFITNSLLPAYIALPAGIIFILLGVLLAKHAQGYDGDMHSYLHIMKPDRSRLVKDGIYKYIRHPRFLCRFITAIGLGVVANNLLAISVVLIHFVPYYAWMKVLDKELVRMFGIDFKNYQNEVPSVFPKYKNLKNFFRLLFS